MSAASSCAQSCARSAARPANARHGAGYPASLALLYPAASTQPGVLKSAKGVPPTYSYPDQQYGADGVSVGAVPAYHAGKGVWCGPAYTNLFTAGLPVAQTKTLTAQKYTLVCLDGSASCSYGTATPSAPLTFTATAGNTTFTPTGMTKWQLTATSVPMPYVPPGTTVVSAAGTYGGNGLAWEMDSKVLAALGGKDGQPAKCTVAAVCKMGVGSADLVGTTTNHTFLAWRDNVGDFVFRQEPLESNVQIVRATDGANYPNFKGTWNRNEKHIKIIQVNAAGTQLRVGNKRIGVNASVVWGVWTTFDGYFNPVTYLRAAYGLTVPMHLAGLQVWDDPEVDEVTIEKYFKKVGAL